MRIGRVGKIIRSCLFGIVAGYGAIVYAQHKNGDDVSDDEYAGAVLLGVIICGISYSCQEYCDSTSGENESLVQSREQYLYDNDAI